MIITPDFIPDDHIWNSETKGNFNKGRSGPGIKILVMHATVGGLQPSRARFRQRSEQVSAHYIIDRDGGIYQQVLDQDTAYHAGVSQWASYVNINNVSLGIELVNKNDGVDPYVQFDTAVELARFLCQKYGIDERNLVRHADVAPGRKSDPKGLDWYAFKGAVYHGTPAPERPPEQKPPNPPIETPKDPIPDPPKKQPAPPEGDTGYSPDAIRGAINGALVDFINDIINRLRGG